MSYYSEIYYLSKEGKKETDVLYQMFFSEIKGKILDIGCSTGNFVALDKQNIIGIDVDKDSIEVAKKRGLNCIEMDIDGKIIKFNDNSFEAINMQSVLEHLDHPLETLKEIYRVLKPNGKLVIAVPDAIRGGFWFWNDYTHKRPFLKESLKRICFDAGFRDIIIEYEPISITGMGWIARKGYVSAKTITNIKYFLLKLNFKNNALNAICKK